MNTTKQMFPVVPSLNDGPSMTVTAACQKLLGIHRKSESTMSALSMVPSSFDAGTAV